MAGRTSKPEDHSSASSAADDGSPPTCGVIMPISRTANHSAEHWTAVQTLLHRCIREAGFIPVNAWRDTVNDRVSERIIGNIFKFPIFVVDISDLNPNVMFELGLRLASKKPTVVVVNKGGDVPFDLKDFHYEEYPSDLNILEMEAFFDKLTAALNEKYEASKDPNYKPFLGDVVIEVVTPQVESVSLNEAVLKQLNDISQRMARLEKSSGPDQLARNFKNHWPSAAQVDDALTTRLIPIEVTQEKAAADALNLLGYEGQIIRFKDKCFVDMGKLITGDELKRFRNAMKE
ncbi:hypothetical protein [Sphingomonas sp. Leaf22]|uniref:hypothetical protein n=1 Tax=Sphingomonas sp. Leaf22 TaxID=1735687 RepID=UPI000A7E2AA4|nr:hypothetical protein [Sphingomonas sp. Leaf22]